MKGFNPLPLIFLLVFAATYLAPVFIAWRRNVADRKLIVLVNIFLGWTGVGWIIAFVLACVLEPKGQ